MSEFVSSRWVNDALSPLASSLTVIFHSVKIYFHLHYVDNCSFDFISLSSLLNDMELYIIVLQSREKIFWQKLVLIRYDSFSGFSYFNDNSEAWFIYFLILQFDYILMQNLTFPYILCLPLWVSYQLINLG